MMIVFCDQATRCLMKFKITLFLMVTVVTVQTLACSCVQGTGNPRACSLDYVIKGMIVDKGGNASLQEDIVYTVQVEGVFRDISGNISVNSSIDIVTGSHTCGYPDYSQGDTKLFAGGYGESSYSLYKCYSVVVPYDSRGVLSYHVDTDCSASTTLSITALLLISSIFAFGCN